MLHNRWKKWGFFEFKHVKKHYKIFFVTKSIMILKTEISSLQQARKNRCTIFFFTILLNLER